MTVVIGGAFTVWRAHGHYVPPGFGGPEPARNHFAAMHILETGVSGLTDYPPGYAYLTALIYVLLPNIPLSVVWFQVVLTGLMVFLVPSQVARRLEQNGFRRHVLFEDIFRLCLFAYYPFTYYAAVYSGIVPALFLATQVLLFSADIILARDEARMRASLKAGIWMGGLAILRPDFAPIGVLFAVTALIRFRTTLREWFKAVMPIGVVSLLMLVTFTILNLPQNGKILHGDAYIARSLLLGSCQYDERFWDFDFAIDSTHPSMMVCHNFINAMEKKYDADFFEPVVAEELRTKAWSRYRADPLMAAKKVLISIVRIWVLTPTQLKNMAMTAVITLQEIVLLLLAVFGALRLIKPTWLKAYTILLLLMPGLTHPFFHIEPRLCLPLKGLEVGLAALTLVVLFGSFFQGADE